MPAAGADAGAFDAGLRADLDSATCMRLVHERVRALAWLHIMACLCVCMRACVRVHIPLHAHACARLCACTHACPSQLDALLAPCSEFWLLLMPCQHPPSSPNRPHRVSCFAQPPSSAHARLSRMRCLHACIYHDQALPHCQPAPFTHPFRRRIFRPRTGHMHTCVQEHIRTHIHACMHALVHAHGFTHAHTLTHTYAFACTHTITHAHTHTPGPCSL